MEEWRLRTDPGYLREKVLARDRGICAACGVDCLAAWRDLEAAAWCRTSQGMGQLGTAQRSRKSLWDADHVVPVIEGGGRVRSREHSYALPQVPSCIEQRNCENAARPSMQHRLQIPHDGARHDLVAFRGGMDAVALDQAAKISVRHDILHQKRDARQLVLIGQLDVNLLERFDVGPCRSWAAASCRPAAAGSPPFAAPTIICSRLARVVSIGSPRNPSLPPNSTITMRGFSASTSFSRFNPSVVVSPLTPAFTTRQASPARSKSFCRKSGKLLPGSAPYPAVRLSPNATITGPCQPLDIAWALTRWASDGQSGLNPMPARQHPTTEDEPHPMP